MELDIFKKIFKQGVSSHQYISRDLSDQAYLLKKVWEAEMGYLENLYKIKSGMASDLYFGLLDTILYTWSM